MSFMAGGGNPSRSASTIVANTASGYHILKIDAYSRTLAATPTGEYIASLPFTMGGHRWHIRYYPNGDSSEAKDYISLFFELPDRATKPVEARYQFRFVGVVAEQPLTLGIPRSFSLDNGHQAAWGPSEFIKREDLEQSKHLQDDSFAIRCDVLVVTKEFRVDDDEHVLSHS